MPRSVILTLSRRICGSPVERRLSGSAGCPVLAFLWLGRGCSDQVLVAPVIGRECSDRGARSVILSRCPVLAFLWLGRGCSDRVPRSVILTLSRRICGSPVERRLSGSAGCPCSSLPLARAGMFRPSVGCPHSRAGMFRPGCRSVILSGSRRLRGSPVAKVLGKRVGNVAPEISAPATLRRQPCSRPALRDDSA